MDRIKVLVTVKAYPAVSKKRGEVVCVAGVRMDTEQPQWVRLFPVPFRDLGPSAVREVQGHHRGGGAESEQSAA